MHALKHALGLVIIYLVGGGGRGSENFGRGANHLICVTDDEIMFKSWIKDVSEAIVNGTTQSGVPADQRLVGTDAHRKYVEKLVPGSSYGKHFINKYRIKKIDTSNG